MSKPDEQAEALREQLSGRTPEAVVTILAQALATARRETWEAAAQIVEDDCYADEEGGLSPGHFRHNRNQRQIAAYIRLQATTQAKEGSTT